MYIDKLQYPHPKLSAMPNLGYQLTEIPELVAASDFPTPQEKINAILPAARRALWFIQGENEDVFDSLVDKQETNCYGYTVVASECLELANVEHYVVYANEHAFLVVPIDGHLRLVDMLCPQLDQNIAPALERNTTSEITDQLKSSPNTMTTAKLNTRTIVEHSSLANRNIDALAGERLWLTTGLRMSSSFASSQEAKLARYTITACIFEPKVGRNVLVDYLRFNLAGSHRAAQAARHLARISGLMPNVDPRANHSLIRGVTASLALSGNIQGALSAASDYFASCIATGAPEHAEQYGDCLVGIARIAGRSDIAGLAIHHYEQALASAKSKQETIRAQLTYAASRLTYRTNT
jgi:hypothetical protein